MKTPATLLLVFSSIFQISCHGQNASKLTVRVLDENGEPIRAAQVRIEFVEKGSRKQAMLNGESDSKGEFTGEGYSSAKLGADVRKDGYYISGSGFAFNDATNGQWQPWNPTTVTVLRRIGKRVPLYTKKVQADVPALDQPCGYDLEVGDWVAPYGKGFKSDFIFKIHRDFKDQFNFKIEAEIAFKEQDDGLLPVTSPPEAHNSVFRWERYAPEIGYDSLPRNLYFINHDPRSGQKQEKNFDFGKRDAGYFFRVRTVKQDGQIVSARYGKIAGDIGIDPRDSKTCMVMFTYYFNPTPNDRNLEWDMKKNLFGGLTDMQTPREP